jgi:hypothetical protein
MLHGIVLEVRIFNMNIHIKTLATLLFLSGLIVIDAANDQKEISVTLTPGAQVDAELPDTLEGYLKI